MKLVADSNGRLACKELFPPGKPFSANRMPDGSIRLVELAEKEVPLVEIVHVPDCLFDSFSLLVRPTLALPDSNDRGRLAGR